MTEKLHELPPIVILRLRNMTALDATGLFALEELARQLQNSGRALILCGIREQPAKLIRNSELEAVIGRKNICENVQDALRGADDLFERLEATTVASSVGTSVRAAVLSRNVPAALRHPQGKVISPSGSAQPTPPQSDFLHRSSPPAVSGQRRIGYHRSKHGRLGDLCSISTNTSRRCCVTCDTANEPRTKFDFSS